MMTDYLVTAVARKKKTEMPYEDNGVVRMLAAMDVADMRDKRLSDRSIARRLGVKISDGY